MCQTKITKISISLTILLGFALSVFADGFIVIPNPPHPRPPYHLSAFPLEVEYHHVDVTINNQIATTRIDQVFFNPTNHRLEGYYLFPLPRNAAIQKFSMVVDGKELEAELLDSAKARKIYLEIVRKQLDPALLEYSESGVFKVRIFPIDPGSRKRVKISYHEFLDMDDGTVGYLYPLNTEKFSAKPLKNVAIKVEIRSAGEIKNIYCPSHQVEIIRKDGFRAIVGFEEKNTRPDMDFKLFYRIDPSKLGFSLLSYKAGAEDGYFFLNLSPGLKLQNDMAIRKDISFVLDVSGSMVGEKLNQAKKALLFCIENLNSGDRFDIIRFSTEAESLFGDLAHADRDKRKQARNFIENLKAIGGTNIDEALKMALSRKTEKGRPYMVVFLTDGKPTIGETDESMLLKNIRRVNMAGTRIFTFGIGNEINTHLLDRITEMTRATRSYVSPEEDIELEVSRFYTKIQSPVLTDLELDFGKNILVMKTAPHELPDLFKGSSLSIFGRYRGSGSTRIILKARIMERQEKFVFEVKDGFRSPQSPDHAKNDFIPPLWAARRIGYLLDQIRLHGESRELVDEITGLARVHGIITPYTSYLIVEDEKARLERKEIRPVDQVLAPAAGNDRDFERRNRDEFKSMHKKSGSGSVRVSEEFQALNQASNFSQMRQGESRLGFIDRKGRTQNVIQQVKNVQGRAIYNNGRYWVDSIIQNQEFKKANRIQFASKAYFDLLANKPGTGQFLALGKNVRFIYEEYLYEIYE
jgi:Ca-activated chloride channel family protein